MPLGVLVLKPMDINNFKLIFSIALVILLFLVLYSSDIYNYKVFFRIAIIVLGVLVL